mmetsp:Transcript_26446/g.39286  ORF Transcript_26446/g.39286 Transcript_26446/m.39286 type:complete len:80 (+) Transcript_26446:59-298(+)
MMVETHLWPYTNRSIIAAANIVASNNIPRYTLNLVIDCNYYWVNIHKSSCLILDLDDCCIQRGKNDIYDVAILEVLWLL